MFEFFTYAVSGGFWRFVGCMLLFGIGCQAAADMVKQIAGSWRLRQRIKQRRAERGEARR